MIFDSHVHTTFSVDADTTITEAIRAAEENGVEKDEDKSEDSKTD